MILHVVACNESVSTHEGDATVDDGGKENVLRSEVAESDVSTQMSGKKYFQVSIHSKLKPLSLNRIHSWIVHVETPDGVAIEDAEIEVYGGMPAHKHGFPTKPRVTENLGGGDYRVDGVKFSMPGRWEMWLIVTANSKRDKVTFKINLP